jgi:hypothetical protein
MVLGLDMLFLGGKQRKKNKGKSKGNGISRFALRASLWPSAERQRYSRWLFTAHVNVCPSGLDSGWSSAAAALSVWAQGSGF